MGALITVCRRVAALLFLFTLGLAATSAAHDIPADATVRMFVKPEGSRLHVLVRVHMSSINDIDWPVDRNGNLIMSRVEPFLIDASTLWISDYLDVYENGVLLPRPKAPTSIRLSTEGDTSFTTYADALDHVLGLKLPEDTLMRSNQGAIDVLFDYPIQSERSRFSTHQRFDRLGLRVVTILRFIAPDGQVRAFEYDRGDPGMIHLDPSWAETARTFAGMGFRGFLTTVDALLFVVGLLVPVRRLGVRLASVIAFGAAIATGLAAAFYGFAVDALWFPPLIATLVAASVLYVAVQNVVEAMRPAANEGARRWIVAFAFGLAHGYAFSFVLKPSLQFTGRYANTGILSFDAGLVLALAASTIVIAPVLGLLFRFGVAKQPGAIVLAALVAHTAWDWLSDRAALLWRYRFARPDFTPAFFADLLRWMMFAVAIAGALWLVTVIAASRRRSLGQHHAHSEHA